MPESPLHGSFNDEGGSSSEWGRILAFIVLANAVTWLACLLLRSTFAAGHLWALFTFLFITVWSPTVIALALSFSFEGTSGVSNLLGLLFRGFSKNNMWYLIGILVPVAAVASAIIVARHLHSGAVFLPLAALPLTLGLQVFTGAMGEELGWRGFLLSHLERSISPRVAALVMAITWALWHLPAFFFPGMPQQHMPPIAFLLMVAAFGIFLALIFNRTRGHLVSTILAHFSFNTLVLNHEMNFAFSWPQCLVNLDGSCRGRVKMSLAYRPVLDARFGSEFVRLNIDARLQQEDGAGFKGRVQQSSLPNSKEANVESDLIEHGLKWWPTKVYEASFPEGKGRSSNWRLVLKSLTRAGQGFPRQGVPFTVVLTISDLNNSEPVFRDMRLHLNSRNVKIADIRTATQLRPTV